MITPELIAKWREIVRTRDYAALTAHLRQIQKSTDKVPPVNYGGLADTIDELFNVVLQLLDALEEKK